MRKPEQLAWDSLRSAMGGTWVAQRHEDKCSVGIPDVSFYLPGGRGGWIELKAADPTGRIRLRPAQVLWAQRRAAIGVDCLLMVRGATGWAGFNFRAAPAGLVRSFDDVAALGHRGTAVDVLTRCLEVEHEAI